MQYGELVTRAFSIVWRHKYLWLLAILGGADVSTGGFGGSFGNPGNLSGGSTAAQQPVTAGEVARQVAQFLSDHAWVFVLVGAIVLLIALAWFVLSCVTTGALIRASAEHDADRPFGFGLAWRAGLGTFWSILGLRLLSLLWVLVVLAVIGVFGLLGVLSYAGGQQGALAAVIAVGVLVGVVLVLASIAVGLAFILAMRAVVLEQRGAVAALGRGLGLLRGRLGRVLVVWLIQLALGVGAALGVFVVLIPVVLLGVALIVAAAVTGGAGAVVAVAIPLSILAVAVLIVAAGLAGGYLSTYWTLAFRRLELEAPRPAPWPAYPPRQPAG
ncbi:MAG TPA: hypothetical protein VOB72_26900 [Candidatus Dormibacteraeota bacterium]|nr:hypothetical protein [Candidatus Dormibacteraeota bacterium]